MKYIALLRGINAGNNRRIDMKDLRAFFESLGVVHVSTYINSGNVFFESGWKQKNIREIVETGLKEKFGFDIPAIIKKQCEMNKIAGAVPPEWRNDSSQRTDVAFLFPEIDSKRILDDLPVKREYIDIRYIRGAVYWNVSRADYNKSRLNRLAAHELYRWMTVRNVNTVRFLTGPGLSMTAKLV